MEPGETLCVGGPNGSGKSTLAQICAGLLVQTSGVLSYGDVRIEGRGALRELRSRVGLLFQSPEDQLFADTVGKDIAFGPRNHGVRGEPLKERVSEAASLVGLPLDELYARSPFSLSEGEKRRVALAGVLAMNPDVLVLDEPFIGLDYEGRERLKAALGLFRGGRGTSIIIVTHELSDAWAMADRFALLAGGGLELKRRSELVSGATDLSEVGIRLPQWGTLARELYRMGIEVEDPSDPRSLAGAISASREGGHGR